MWLLRRYLLVPVAVLPGHCGFLRVQQHAALIAFGPGQKGHLPCREAASLAGGHGDRAVCECLGFSDVKRSLPQALFQRCEKLRPLLFRLASETVDDDEALGKSQGCPWISLR